jgi:iron-sulfur cluster assembly protein
MDIQLTERAARHVKDHVSSSDSTKGIRIRVKATGCSGYAYVVEPLDSVANEDKVFECLGVKVAVDAQSYPLLAGTVLDYAREGLNEGFKFNNPNVKDTCGCGESFSVEATRTNDYGK